MNRREFLRRTTVGAASISMANSLSSLRAVNLVAAPKDDLLLPRRVLGKTGVRVSQLAFGSGSRFMMYETEEKALTALTWALDHGINYVDTAHDYGKGESERRIGMLMKERRNQVFLVTKLGSRDTDEFLKQFELSLKRLQTDHVDLLHLHSLGKMDDVDKIGEKGGVYETVCRLKEQKATRFIGFTSHTDGSAAKRAVERFDFDCCMMQLNPSKAGGFEDLTLPAALNKKMGVVAMKVTAQEKLLGSGSGKAEVQDLLRYTLSLPVAAANVGMPTIEMLKQNIEIAKDFRPLSAPESKQLQDRLAVSRAGLENFFRQHRDVHCA